MKTEYNEVNSCEVCGSEQLSPVLNLGKHPMCDDLVPFDDTRVCIEYPIEILYCSKCRTAHQRYQVPKKDLFPSSYHYRSRFTADVLKGMEDLVSSCDTRFGSLNGKKVLDIGCNDGSLLDFFRENGAITFGIEPTDAYKDALAKKHNVQKNFLTPAVATAFVKTNGNPDFIVFTNVFAHIENLKEVIESLKILKTEDTAIIIENHYLGSVMKGNQFDTFYHEHPRTYSYKSFVYIAEALEMKLLHVEFPARYGGNIRVFLGASSIRAGGDTFDTAALDQQEAEFSENFSLMNQNIEKWKLSKRQQLEGLYARHGKLKAKAFPGRAAILIKLLNLDENLISAVYEKPGSMKIGHYLPGTRIPILSDEELFSDISNCKVLLNLAWHIPAEIRRYLEQHGFKGELVDILSPQDFSAHG